jgi:hypothetical protein
VREFSLDDLPADLAFDHAQILRDYRHYKDTGAPPRPSP